MNVRAGGPGRARGDARHRDGQGGGGREGKRASSAAQEGLVESRQVLGCSYLEIEMRSFWLGDQQGDLRLGLY